MESVVAGPVRDCCTVFFDDVLVIGKTFKDHLANLRKIFEHLHLAVLKLRAEKCFFGGSEVEYLGNVVSRHGISVDERKVHDLQMQSLLSFLGFQLTSYYRRFIPNFSRIAKHMQM